MGVPLCVSYVTRSLTLTTVAVLVQLEAFCAIALVHAVVQLVAVLFTGTALVASSWKRAEEEVKRQWLEHCFAYVAHYYYILLLRYNFIQRKSWNALGMDRQMDRNETTDYYYTIQ